MVKKLSCNRAIRKLSYVSSSIRKSSSIMYGCSWHVRFKDVERDKYADAGHVVITAIGGFHSNTGDHYHED